MDNKHWKDWDARSRHKEDSTQNPYYNQPTHSPYRNQGFAIASMVFGILSFLLNCFVGVPFFFAGFSFLFTALACRRGKTPNRLVSYGVMSSFFGISSGIYTLVQLLSQLDILPSSLLP